MFTSGHVSYEPSQDDGSASILLVDPAAGWNSPIVECLAVRGFDVLIAANLRTALDLLSSTEISHALVELRYDDGVCYDLIPQIRATNPGSRIMLHSALCNVAVAVNAVKLGADDVLPKPVGADFATALLLGEDARRSSALRHPPTSHAVGKEHIKTVYQSCSGNVSRTAEKLKMHRRTLQRILTRTSPAIVAGMPQQQTQLPSR